MCISYILLLLLWLVSIIIIITIINPYTCIYVYIYMLSNLRTHIHTHTRFSTVSPSLYASTCIKIRLVCSCVARHAAHNTSDCEVFNAIWFNHYRNLDLGSSRHPVGTRCWANWNIPCACLVGSLVILGLLGMNYPIGKPCSTEYNIV